ncbi:hypothetical protein Tco_0823497 [Tanacetum coccineum]|uniref:Uncharacterized protein n=1 Tax=Tanacetum coccineum TaxID=301880 RepID=A0ABQ5AMG5_9ASTR
MDVINGGHKNVVTKGFPDAIGVYDDVAYFLPSGTWDVFFAMLSVLLIMALQHHVYLLTQLMRYTHSTAAPWAGLPVTRPGQQHPVPEADIIRVLLNVVAPR